MGLIAAAVVAVLLIAGALAYAARTAESREQIQRTTSGSVQSGTKGQDTDKNRGQEQQNDSDDDGG